MRRERRPMTRQHKADFQAAQAFDGLEVGDQRFKRWRLALGSELDERVGGYTLKKVVSLKEESMIPFIEAAESRRMARHVAHLKRDVPAPECVAGKKWRHAV